jgi:hypothetical protein
MLHMDEKLIESTFTLNKRLVIWASYEGVTTLLVETVLETDGRAKTLGNPFHRSLFTYLVFSFLSRVRTYTGGLFPV